MNSKIKTSLLIWGLQWGAVAHSAPPDLPPEVKVAMQTCFAKVGLEVSETKRPDLRRLNDEQRESLKTCLNEKGVEFPPRRPPEGERGERPPRPPAAASSRGSQGVQ